MLGEWAKHSYLAGMLATLFIIAKKATLVLAGHILVLHAGDTVDARQLPKGKAAIEVQVGGSLHALGTAQRPVVLLGGKGTLISTKGQLYLQHCTLVGPQPKSPTFAALTGTGIQINGPATISNCTFRNYKTAIMLRSASATPPTIKANQFLQNQTAISINTNSSTPVNLDLSCNVFEPGTSPTAPYGRTLAGNAVGIKVISGSLGDIGFLNPTAGTYTFAANVWPAQGRLPVPSLTDYNTNPDVLQSIWSSPALWTSIEANGTGTYYKYRNEFLGTNSGLVRIALPEGSDNKYVRESGQAPSGPVPANQFDERCNSLPGDPFIAPTSKPSDGNPSARIGEGKESYLLQNIPNPANRETIIGYHIADKYQFASLEIVELATGKTKQIISLQPSAPKALVLSLKSYPNGLYGYKLIMDGKVLDTKKMLVQP